MKRLLNTLYVTSGNKYLSLDGENVVVLKTKKKLGEFRCTIYSQLLLLGTREPVRHLWGPAQNEI